MQARLLALELGGKGTVVYLVSIHPEWCDDE